MGAVTAEEVASLQREFDWVLTTEVDNVTRELKAAVTVSRHTFPSNWCHMLLLHRSVQTSFPYKLETSIRRSQTTRALTSLCWLAGNRSR